MGKVGTQDEKVLNAFDTGTLSVVESDDAPPTFFYKNRAGDVVECRWRWNWQQTPPQGNRPWGSGRTSITVGGVSQTFYRSRMMVAAQDLHLLLGSYDPATGERFE